jgi:hypothetical protein
MDAAARLVVSCRENKFYCGVPAIRISLLHSSLSEILKAGAVQRAPPGFFETVWMKLLMLRKFRAVPIISRRARGRLSV